MTITPNPTAEQIVHDAIYGTKLMEPELRTLLANDSWALSRKAVAALRAAGLLVGDPQETSAHVNPVDTSGERVKNQADSFNVAQQEPSEPTYSPTTGQWSSYCPCIRVEQVDPECEWHGRPEFRRWVRGGGR